jgi:crotonobetainyl-CoA:carnitine CoA-transferase CaiB-like acyl-CoA transferase
MRPLADLKVIEIAENMCGPLYASYMGDLGADVIKVELPRGDRFRKGPSGIRLAFLHNNRSKRSVVIDFKRPDGLALLHRLVGDADVFVDAARPGVAEARGYGWDVLKKINDRLIFCKITGFGPTGPYSHKPAIGVIVQAVSGVMYLNGAEDGKPTRLGPPMECWSAVAMALVGTLSALHMRDRSGTGQRVDVSVLDSVINSMAQRMLDFPVRGQQLRPRGTKHFWLAPHKTYKTSDGYITVGVQEEDRWHKFAAGIGMPELVSDRRFVDNDTRLTNEDALYDILDPLFASKTSREWAKILEAADQYFAIVNTPESVFTDPQVLHNRTFVDIDDPDVPGLKMINTPIKLSAAEVGITRRPPHLGEHTVEVLREFGLTATEIDRLITDEIVVQEAEGQALASG